MIRSFASRDTERIFLREPVWRICFRWQAGDALDVEIVDYH